MRGNEAVRPRAIEKTSQPKRWRVFVVTLICGALVGAGFFLAGRQHFSSMDFSIKNSRLRKQIDDLESEKRRLLLAREVAQSPAEIKKAAKKAGLNDAAAIVADIAKIALAAKPKPAASVMPPTKSPGVVKTAEVSAVRSSPARAYQRPERISKQVAKEMRAE
jgi:hypothetical protein